jgi:hypothetical protein
MCEPGHGIGRQPEVGDRLPEHDPQAIFASGTPTALETNGTVREARGLASMT